MMAAANVKKVVTKKNSPKAGKKNKKLTVELEQEFYQEFIDYVTYCGFSPEDFVRKAVKEKMDRDRISSMIDHLTIQTKR